MITKNLFMLLLGLFLACNSSQKTLNESTQVQGAVVNASQYANTITEAELKEYLYTYASDAFEGRDTGTPGQKKAVAYIKEQYVKMGVDAAQGNGEYFQNVPLEIARIPKGTISAGDRQFMVEDDFLTLTSLEGTFNSIVYAGYGIDEENYSDFEGLDLKGKILLIKAGEPRNADGSYTLSGNYKPSAWSNMSDALGKRTEVAQQLGARAILFYDDTNYDRYKRAYSYTKYNARGRMGIKSGDHNPTIIVVNKNMAEALLPSIESENKATTIPTALSFDIKSSNEDIDSENVIALIKGSEKPDEYVVISSHLDHIGINANGEINNGADDDGSGTVAMLEIAEAFKKAADAGHGPKRSVVFLHVTGEEKGLLGSKYYTDVAPVFPLSQTVANLNIDMIGRTDPKRIGDREYVYLIGSDKLSSELHQISETVNKQYTQLQLDYTYNDENDPNRFYYRSDHYNFAKNDIPIIFYFSGTHEDYHRPGDTADKINYDLLKLRTQLIFYTAWEVANRDRRVILDRNSR